MNLRSYALAALLSFPLGALWLDPIVALALNGHDATVHAVRASQRPAIDLRLQAPEWKQALTLSHFFDETDRQTATQPTTAYLLYDDKFLYVGIRATQRGIPITAKQTVNHAGVDNDDYVAVSFDTSGNGSRVYTFRVSPTGIHDESSTENARYAPEWTSIAKTSADGYAVIMIIPLSDVRAQSGDKQKWRFNVYRYIAIRNELDTWAYEPTMTSAKDSQYWPWLADLTLAPASTKPHPHVDVFTLQSGGRQRQQFQDNVGAYEHTAPRALGIDFTVPLTDTAALVGTINPDFSNIEQDQTIIAPQEFPLAYSEYRPFFAQGANFIDNLPTLNINSFETLFYTPSIGIFNTGLKFEGTEGLSSFGALNASGVGFSDSAIGYTYSASDHSFTAAAEQVLANHRASADPVVDDATGLALATTNPHSGMIGVLRYAQDRGTSVNNAIEGNEIEFGTGIHNSRETALLVYRDIGPLFSPLDGYVQQNDIRGPQAFYQYDGVSPASRYVKSYSAYVGGDRYRDGSSAIRQADAFSGVTINLRNTMSIGYSDNVGMLRQYAVAYPVYSDGETLPYNSESISFGFRDGTPSPTDVTYSYGPFAGYYLTQTSAQTTRRFKQYTVSLEYDSSVQHGLPQFSTAGIDSQWLRRVSIARSFGKDATLSIGVRSINGTGGFASPGQNLAVAFHQRFKSMDELFLNFGTPASPTTLDRFLVKYVFHVGGSTGT